MTMPTIEDLWTALNAHPDLFYELAVRIHDETPKIAGPWTMGDRYDLACRCIARVKPQEGTTTWICEVQDAKRLNGIAGLGFFATQEEAEAVADKYLVNAGWRML